MAADIFVSFASKDVRVAMTLCGALENRGFTCWISARDIEPGANFQSAIVRALRQAKIMLLVFTANSNTSEEMTKELALASQNKMIVIPLRVEDVTPNDAFAYEFATRQWIDVFADWEAAIEQLSRRIGQALLDRSVGKGAAAADALKTVIASAAAAKLTDSAPAENEMAPVEAVASAAREAEPEPAPPAGEIEPSVEAAVKALEALEAGAAEPAASFDSPADAELPPASDDDLWPAAAAEIPPEEPPAAKKPMGLLIAAAAAVLVVIGIVIALVSHGGSKTPPAPAAAPSSAEPSSAAPASATAPAEAAPPAAAAASSTAPSAASDEAQTSQAAAPAAPKPAKHKKAQPKVDIPF